MLILAFAGCGSGAGVLAAGLVSVEGIDDFGTVADAAWIHWADGPEDSYDSILLSNQGDLCGTWQAWGEVYGRYRAALEEVSYSNYCREMMDLSIELAETTSALATAGGHSLTINVTAGDSTVPQAHPYSNDDERAMLGMSLVYYVSDPPSMDQWDPEGSSSSGCGIDPDEVADASRVWTLASGDLDFSAVLGEDRAEATGQGTLENEAGEAEGQLSVDFDADWCEVKLGTGE